MGGEYRMVSEEEYQNLLEAIDHEQRMREMEADSARRWQERAEAAEKRAERNPWAATWTYSDDPAGFNECRCDEPKPAGHWTSDREWEADPEPCDGCAVDYVYASPQRPHESLVWAMLMAALVSAVRLSPQGTILEVERIKDQTDILLNWWRERWPESED